MKLVFGWVLLLGVALSAAGSSYGAWAPRPRPRPPACDPRDLGGGGGGDIPTPFLSSNQRVELADGELYTLIGRVRFLGSLPYLEVDLEEHPWLANAKRKNLPFYPLLALPSYWRRYESQRVRAYVEAHTTVNLSDPDGSGQIRAEYVIALQPLADPTRLEQ